MLTFNSFVDRDMFMRYVGGGIGHEAIQQVTNDDSVMDIDEAVEPEGSDDRRTKADRIAELQEAAKKIGSMPGERDEVEELVDSDYSDSTSSVGSDDEDHDSDDLGPEDGEDEWNVVNGSF
jgi:hypothetical protein